MTFLRRWYRNTVKPRFVYCPFLLMRLILVPSKICCFLYGKNTKRKTLLCIEAGSRGWESIEFKELYASACEYLEISHVQKVVINKDCDYIPQVVEKLNLLKPTHYFYDPRTGSQGAFLAIYQAFRIGFEFYIRGVTPIVILTDPSIRRWRAQSAMVTAISGVVVCFISSKEISPIFPHTRLIGPSLMPFSIATINRLHQLRDELKQNPQNKAVFLGSLYEPRTSMLNSISEGLEKHGKSLDIRGRVAGGPRVSDEDYWLGMINSSIIVTTADQIPDENADWTWIPQMVYRYLEVMACGSLLVAPSVPGLKRYFSPNIHFAEFNSTHEAVEKIVYYLNQEEDRLTLTQRGRDRAFALVSSRVYWTSIDAALGTQSLI